MREADPHADRAALEALEIAEMEAGHRRQITEAVERMRDPALTASGGGGLVLVRFPPGTHERVVGVAYRAWTSRRCRLLNLYLAEDAPRNVRLATATVVILFTDYLSNHSPSGELAVEAPAGYGTTLLERLGFRNAESTSTVERWVVDAETWASALRLAPAKPWFGGR